MLPASQPCAVRGNDRCCENHCCKPLEVNGRFVDSCCGPGCCNGDRPVCCDIPTALCCKTGECCGGGAAGIGKCCEPPLECCKGPGGVPIDCCDPNKGEICDNGVCRQAPKFAYNGSGGGKALAETDSTVSIFRFTVSGSGSLLPPNGVADTTSITGNLDAFNYKTRTRITMSQFTGFEGLLGNGTTTIAVAGHALVNGVPMLVNFSARKAGGVITFELKNANTNVALAEGIGEAGRAAISLTVQ